MPSPKTANPTIPSRSRALSSGMLAFLVTDIEGSTYRWELFPDAMRSALERHDAILRKAVLARDGHIFKTAGYFFHAAFSSPSAAVAAALEAQQALSGEDFIATMSEGQNGGARGTGRIARW